MPTFTYKAIAADGSVAEGQIDAGNRPDAFRQMETRGLRPVSLAEQANGGRASLPASRAAGGSAGASPYLGFKKSNKVTAKALENFTRLLSSLLAAGVPLSRALVILYREATTPAAAAKWKEIHDQVVDGMALADAMAQ